MDKLGKRFNELDLKDTYDNDVFYHDSERCAELTKEIAIKYAEFVGRYFNQWIHSWGEITDDELFNKFIDEYYG